MLIEIAPMKPEDAREIMLMSMAALAGDPLFQAGFPKDMTPEQEEEHVAWRTQLIINRSKQPNRHYFKAVDTSNDRIVGFMAWHGPLPKTYDPASQGDRYAGVPTWLDKKHYDDLAEMFKKGQEGSYG